jgi:diguanylate cyclase (GGDEF)-like protein
LIRGLHIHEERLLAGRLASALYLTGAVTGALMLVMPGVHVTATGLVAAIAAGGFAWGLLGWFVIPWRTAPPIVSHLSSFMGLPVTAAVMACTGGAASPARFYLLFIVFYCSYFYPPREAVLYLVGCMAVHALPVLYAGNALDEGFVAELVVILPIYAVLGGLIIASKQLQLSLREKATALALIDPLTGVANRRAFEAAMELGAAGGGRAIDRTGVLLVDLDDFKSANTLFGHTGGDRVLCAAAEALREAARGNDMVARLGGDEFVILASGSNEVGTARLADRVLECLRRADEGLDLPGFRLTASVGWATYPAPVKKRGELLDQADLALAAAKASGKSTGRAAETRAVSRSLPVSTP